MIWEDQGFVVDVVVIELTWETTISNVINRPTNATTELSTIIKTHKYRRLHEGHHFFSMAMEVHSNRIWIVSLGSVFVFSTIDI
jgi:hypothetical protein